MPNAYNIRWGIVFSLSIALLISVPMLIRQDIAQFAFNTGLFFIPILVGYLVAYYLRAKIQLRNSRLKNEYQKLDQLKAQLLSLQQHLFTFHDSQKVTVRTELTFMKSYLYIIKERFNDALHVSVRISESFLEYCIPPLTLQILVENALKHNIISTDQPLYLNIYTSGQGKLTVENSFQPGLTTEEGNGKGLQKDLFIVTIPLLEP